MPVRSTLELGNPHLRQPAQPVPDPRSPETRALIADLWDTLHEFRERHGWGRALSAPVIGVPQRVSVINFDERQIVLINPRFETWSRAQTSAFESCMAFSSIWGAVVRPERIVVAALDDQGREQRYEVDGDLARIVQHEIDHLDGLVWLDRDPDLATICTTGEYMRQFKHAGSMTDDQ